jgi:hypothetical protein
MPTGPNATSPEPAPAGEVVAMSFQLVLIFAAVAAFAALAAFRVLRVRAHRDPVDGSRRIAGAALLLLAPPLVLQLLFAPVSGTGRVDGIGAVLISVVAFAAVWLVMQLASLVVARLAPPKNRPVLLLAMTGRDTSNVVPFDPPMTAALADDVAAVDRLNGMFPRGRAFMDQSALPGFRATWDALDEATRTLEADIGDQRRLGLGISEHALETASDARGRLDALRSASGNSGQAWAT